MCLLYSAGVLSIAVDRQPAAGGSQSDCKWNARRISSCCLHGHRCAVGSYRRADRRRTAVPLCPAIRWRTGRLRAGYVIGPARALTASSRMHNGLVGAPASPAALSCQAVGDVVSICVTDSARPRQTTRSVRQNPIGSLLCTDARRCRQEPRVGAY